MKPNVTISIKLYENDLKIDLKMEEGKETDVVALLLALANQEMYAAILQQIQNMYDMKKITKDSYETILNTLRTSLKLIQSQQEDTPVMRPSQVFR